jgi:hypothetical protein
MRAAYPRGVKMSGKSSVQLRHLNPICLEAFLPLRQLQQLQNIPVRIF